jgi:hypothetical protein
MSGTLKVDGSGNVELKEEDGIDYAATTVQLPGGERVPFLFTVKQLEAKGTLDAFGGDFVVPSYRGATFLDPKVREEGAVDGHCGHPAGMHSILVCSNASPVPCSEALHWDHICSFCKSLEEATHPIFFYESV